MSPVLSRRGEERDEVKNSPFLTSSHGRARRPRVTALSRQSERGSFSHLSSRRPLLASSDSFRSLKRKGNKESPTLVRPQALALAYAYLLTALGAVDGNDWDRGPVWLAVSTSPLVVSVTLALLAPVCDDALEK